MEENVRKELEALKGMVLRWKREYLGWVSSDGGNEFLAKEFLEEIDTHVFPYVRRMYECNHLSGPEAKEFLDYCYNRVEELRDSLREVEAKQLETRGG
jgi:phage/plasmid-associated DNA primase